MAAVVPADVRAMCVRLREPAERTLRMCPRLADCGGFRDGGSSRQRWPEEEMAPIRPLSSPRGEVKSHGETSRWKLCCAGEEGCGGEFGVDESEMS